MKKLIVMFMVSTLLLGTLGGCGKKDDGKIDVGVSIASFDDTFLMYMKDGMEAYANEHSDTITIEFVDAAEDMAKQMDQVENFVVQQKDAIIVIPVDTSATGPITDTAKEAETPLVYVNRNPGNLPEGAYYVGSQDIVAGRLQMEWLAETLNGKANVAVLMGKLDNEGALARTKGNEEVAADFPDMNIVDKQTGKWQRNEGMMVTEDWLNKFGEELNAVLCNNDDMALGAAQALKDAGRDDVLVLGVDATPDGISGIEAGMISATVFQDAAGQGGGAVKTAFSAASGETVTKETWIPFQLVTPENLADFK